MASIAPAPDDDFLPLSDLPATTREPPPPHANLKSLDDLSVSPPFTDRFIAITIGEDSHVVSTRQPLSCLSNLTHAPPDLTPIARIVLVELGNPRVPELNFLPPEVVKRHINGGDDALLPANNTLDKSCEAAFLVKWPRLVRQHKIDYEDEMRIRAGKCYDAETFRDWDPLDLAQNHKRHYSWPDYPNRSYGPVFESKVAPDIGVFHAAYECASYFQTKMSGITTGRCWT